MAITRTRTFINLSICLSSCVALSACTLLNPYHRDSRLDQSGAAAAGLPASTNGTNVAILGAIDVASAQRKVYYDACGARAIVRNGLPLVLLPLSAAAIYKGVSGTDTQGGRNTLLKEGLAGATVYGLGSYYNSTTREQVYLEGAKALSCSIYAVTPYYLPDELAKPLSLDALTKLQKQRDALAQAVDALKARQQAIFTAQPDLKTRAPATVQALLARADAAVASATTSLSNADAVIKESITDRGAIEDAAAKLRLNVEDIVQAVDDQLRSLEPDLSVLLNLVGSLAANAQKLAPGAAFKAPTTVPAPPTGAAAVGAADQDLAQLPRETDLVLTTQKALDEQIASQRVVLVSVAQRINKATQLSACQVKPVQGRLQVSPGDASVDLHLHEIKQFTLRSGAGIPNAEFIGTVATTAGRPVSLQKQVAGNTLIVSVTYDTEVEGVSSVGLEFSDGTALDGQKVVTLNLVKSEGNAPADQSAASPKAKKTPAAPAEPAAPAAKPAASSTNPAAGAAGPEPQKPATQPAPAAGTEIPAPDAQADKPANPTEQALPDADRKALQLTLGIPQTGKFDDATHRALRKWQDDRQWAGPHDGVLTPALLAEIGKKP